LKTTHYCYFEPRRLYKLLAGGRRHVERVQAVLSDFFQKPVLLLNSARTGIYLSIAAHGVTRRDEVLVPPFLSECVLNTINRTGFPALQLSPRTKVLLAVHQFGYPQKMDKIVNFARENGLLLIEDCAFSFLSSYRGRLAASYGDTAVFSFPKNLPTILGGCLVTEDKTVLDFARKYLKKQSGLLWSAYSTMALVPTMFTYATDSGSLNDFARYLLEMCYSQFPNCPNPDPRVCRLFPGSLAEMYDAIERRKHNLEIVRRYFLGSGYPADLEENSDLAAFVAPYFDAPQVLENIVPALKKIGVETAIYHFDRNRNMLEPDYQKCVPLPVHQGVTPSRMGEICQAVAEVVECAHARGNAAFQCSGNESAADGASEVYAVRRTTASSHRGSLSV
jgi:dTDP-4-amino-4,6-dideoxygalactose transaminase